MKKKMGKITAVSHTKLKQKFKKYLAETGDEESRYETQVAKYRENPQDSEDEEEESEEEEKKAESVEEEEDDEDEDSEEKAAVDGAKAEAKKEADGDDDEEGADEYYDEEDYGDEDEAGDAESDGEIDHALAGEIHPKLKQKYAFLWKTREEMTASERRWKWVKKESLPMDLQTLMDKLMGGKKNKGGEGGEDDDDKKRTQGVQEEKEYEESMTQIKRDYLSIDFKLFPNVQEIVEALKEERLKAKYSSGYHVEVLQKILLEMPCVETHEVQMKVQVIIILVGTLF